MKRIFLILFALLSFNGFIFSQKIPEFKLTKDGIKPLIIELDSGYNANLIYTRIKEWIALNNKYPGSVTRVDKENSQIKFSCYKKDAFKITDNNTDYWNEMQYTFLVDIKDYRFRIIFDTNENRYDFWFNDDGTVKPRFKGSKASFENTVNETLTSLYKHIKGLDQTKTDEW